MGDVLMTLPALDEISAKYPQASIDVLTSSDGFRVFSLLKHKVNQLFVFRNHIKYRWLDTLNIKKILGKESYDLVYCFESKQRYLKLLQGLPVNKCQMDDGSQQHFSEKCLQQVENASLNKDARNNRYLPFSNKYNSIAQQGLIDCGVGEYDTLIALHPTYSGSGSRFKTADIDRIWGVEKWVELAQLLHQQFLSMNKRVCMVMDLLPNEQSIGEEIVKQSAGLVKLVTLSPNFKRYAAFIDLVDLVIAPNTGVMHLAATLNTPVVALFSGLHAWDCGPYAAAHLHRVLAAEDYSGSNGLAAIPARDVAKAAFELIEAKQSTECCV